MDVLQYGHVPARTQRRRKDASVVGYLQLAHNRRVDGVTQAEVLLNLGREDQLDVTGLRRLARSIDDGVTLDFSVRRSPRPFESRRRARSASRRRPAAVGS